MVRSGRHRLPKPAVTLALVAALLVSGGVVTLVGTASADSESGRSQAAADDRGGGDGDRGGGDRDRGGGRDNDNKDDDGDKKDNDKDGKDNDKKDNDKDNKDDDGDKKDNDKKDNDKKDNDKKDDDGDKKKDDEEFPGRDKIDEADDDDYIDIRDVDIDDDLPRNQADASTGSFVARCGTNENGHLNSDNFMAAPNKRNGAQHVHDYVGNLSTDAFSDDESLHRAGTTCDRDNRSTFFWPVIRNTTLQGDDEDEDGGGLDGNFGKILRPASVDLRFRGNPTTKVKPMPDDLEMIMGDAKAKTNGDKNAKPQWTCTGFENRITEKYPICPGGSKLKRILEYPSCWDGENLNSKDLRSHVKYPDEDGSCDDDFEPIPRLEISLTYNQPSGRDFAMDSFPDQQHDPRTDHSDFMNIAPDAVNEFAANCINSGKNC